MSKSMTEIFTHVYEKNIWGNGSGAGSSIKYNKKYIAFLEDFLVKKQIKSVLDIGCGDWQFSQAVRWGEAHYTGVDCVASVIDHNKRNFPTKDFHCYDSYKWVNSIHNHYDLVILKDVLQHWSNENIITFLDALVDCDYKYILIVNSYKECKGENRSVKNRYRYDKLDCNCYPLNKYSPEYLFTYQHKQVSLISK